MPRLRNMTRRDAAASRSFGSTIDCEATKMELVNMPFVTENMNINRNGSASVPQKMGSQSA